MTFMKALYFRKFGTSQVLEYGDLPVPTLVANELLVKTDYIGLNFADIYRRRGHYHLEKHSPYINGYEAAGTVVAGDERLLGQRVLFVDVPLANAELVAVAREQLIFLPDDISTKMAATVGLQGLTADFLAHDLGQSQAGDKVFVTGISGGVGQILAQILTADGLKVYGSASTAPKRALALELGATAAFDSRDLAWQAQWQGQFDRVYDGIGSTVAGNLDLLKHRGRLIFFGMAGGNPAPVDLLELMNQSKSILTGDLWDFLTSFEERAARSQRLFAYLRTGQLQLSEPTIFALSEGKIAHDFLENGQNIGKVLLKP